MICISFKTSFSYSLLKNNNYSTLNFIIMQKIFLIKTLFCATLLMSFVTACNKDDLPKHQNDYEPDVAVAWMNMYLRLTKATPGFNSVVAARAYAYAGFALYESVAPGAKDLQSITPQLNSAPAMPKALKQNKYYWPASANAAMASITKKLFGNATPALVTAIDSLEIALKNKMKATGKEDEIQRAEAFGKQVADIIFEWSKTDGGHEAYNNTTSTTYIPPTGEGLWVATPPAFGKPLHPYWGNNRSFIANAATETQPAPPLPFSTDSKSEFYKEVWHLYMLSKNLNSADSITVKFWGDITGNYNAPAHATNIVTQLVVRKHLSLHDAAVLYCKHGIAYNDALISSFKTKYRYNLLRPITYIRTVLEQPNWNSVIPTPPHPEYASNHAVISSASAKVLEERFGKEFSFTDKTYEQEYGVRNYSSFSKYAEEAAMSRVLGGIHYRFTALSGLEQGVKVGKLVNGLRFRK
jgi:hypothetical protein